MKGRPVKYPIQDMVIGEERLIPWRVDAAGNRLSNRPITNAICQEQRLKKKKFAWKAQPLGLVVTRIS